MDFKNVIILSPHPDDAEFSSGGTIHKLIEEGAEVWNIVFSPCNKSLPDGFKEDALFDELEKSNQRLGIKNDNIIKFRFPVREFPRYRQEILEELIKVKRQINPDLVLVPNSKDVHQDHHVIYEEGVRAFKSSRILGYELPWNSISSVLNFFVTLKQSDLDSKIAAIEEYKSQEFREYKEDNYFFYLAKIRGLQANVALAEAFELIKWVY